MDLLSHPFRLERNGAVAVVLDGTEEAIAEAIAITALTRKGERPLVPDFGVTDPVFDELDLAELNAVLATFGPDVDVAAVSVDYPTDTLERAVLTFDLGDE